MTVVLTSVCMSSRQTPNKKDRPANPNRHTICVYRIYSDGKNQENFWSTFLGKNDRVWVFDIFGNKQ